MSLSSDERYKLSNIQCRNCGDFIGLDRVLPTEILQDIRYLVEVAESDDFAPYPNRNADLTKIKERLSCIGIFSV